MGLIYAVRRFTDGVRRLRPARESRVALGRVGAWFSWWIGFAGPILGVFLMLLFPDGRIMSRRWRIVAWATIFGAAITALTMAFRPGILLTHRYVDNPFGIVGVIGAGLTTY